MLRYVFLLFALLMLFFGGFLQSSAPAGSCSMDVSVRVYFSPNYKKMAIKGKTVLEIFEEDNMNLIYKNYYKYAKYIEYALKDSVKRKYCKNGKRINIKINIAYVPLLIHDPKDINFIKPIIRNSNSYAKIKVRYYLSKIEVQATFVYNLRKMWQDVLVYLQGWRLKKDKRLILPYSYSKFREMYKIYRKIIFSTDNLHTMKEREFLAYLALKDKIPDDIFALYDLYSGTTLPRIYPGTDRLGYAIKRISSSGIDGYILITMIYINSYFGSKNNIFDEDRIMHYVPLVRALYMVKLDDDFSKFLKEFGFISQPERGEGYE